MRYWGYLFDYLGRVRYLKHNTRKASSVNRQNFSTNNYIKWPIRHRGRGVMASAKWDVDPGSCWIGRSYIWAGAILGVLLGTPKPGAKAWVWVWAWAWVKIDAPGRNRKQITSVNWEFKVHCIHNRPEFSLLHGYLIWLFQMYGYLSRNRLY